MMHLSEAAIATQGRVIGPDVLFTAVGTDSRSLVKGQLFVALKGENFDGHAFADQSLRQGAAAAMVSVEQEGLAPVLLVEDTRLGLGKLAAYWRTKFDIPFVAVTGSNGKTTVKEMLSAILRNAEGSNDAVLATEGNLNNDIGLPLTLLKLRSQHRYAVVEMGMNHTGEISYLTRIAKPTVALVNNAAFAHLGELGSVEAIAKAKGEIFEGLAESGIAVINADDDFAPLWKDLAGHRKILTFGLEKSADVSATYQLGLDASDIRLQSPHGAIQFSLPVAGVHNIRNALAAATAALAMGIPLAAIAKGLTAFGGVKGRLQHKTGLHGAVVIDDTYNANPASMKAAIDVLSRRDGQKFLVMGDMGELGSDGPALHAEIGSYARQTGVSALYALGELSRMAVKAFGSNAHHYGAPEALAAVLTGNMTASTTVLVKGSRFMRMERVVDMVTTKKDREAA